MKECEHTDREEFEKGFYCFDCDEWIEIRQYE